MQRARPSNKEQHSSTIHTEQRNDKRTERNAVDGRSDTSNDTMNFLASLSWQNTDQEKRPTEDKPSQNLFEEEELLSGSEEDEDGFSSLSRQKTNPLTNSSIRTEEIRNETLLNFHEDQDESETSKNEIRETQQQPMFDPFADFDNLRLNSESGAGKTSQPEKSDNEFLLDAFTESSTNDRKTTENTSNVDFIFDSMPSETNQSGVTSSTNEEDLFGLNEYSNSASDVNLLGSWDIHNVKDSIPNVNIPRNNSSSNIQHSSSASNIQSFMGSGNSSIPRINSGTFTGMGQQSSFVQSRSGNNSPLTTGSGKPQSTFDPFADLGNFMSIQTFQGFCFCHHSNTSSFNIFLITLYSR